MIFTSPRSRSKFYGAPGIYVTAFRDFLTGRAYKDEEDIAALEQRMAVMLGVKHALCMPQNRVGLYMALRALIGEGQSVIMSPYTIFDVVNMVICAGGVPVFADIDRPTSNISADHIERLIGDNTGAVLITHLHGIACDVERIQAICRERGIPLLEDTAQAFGGKVGGKPLGTFGDVGIYSFGMAKNVNSFYGGMIVTDRDDIYDKVAKEMSPFPFEDAGMIRNRAMFCMVGDIFTSWPIFQVFTFWLFRFGYLNDVETVNKRVRGEGNFHIKRAIPDHYLKRMSPLQARLVAQQLDGMERDISASIGYAKSYHEGLSDLQGVILPPLKTSGDNIYLSFPIQIPDRHAILRYLMKHGRDLTVQHITNTADLPCFKEFQRDCPNAIATADQVLLLPTYPKYGAQEVDRNIRLIRRYFGDN